MKGNFTVRLILKIKVFAFFLLIFNVIATAQQGNGLLAPLPQPPTVTTTAASSVTSSSAQTGGNVTSDGGDAVTERRAVYSTSTSTSTTSDAKVPDASGGTGTFTSNLTGLSPSTTYNDRAYAINSSGTNYGSTVNATTLLGGKTWVGGTGNWMNPAGWLPAGVPVATDDVTINTGGNVTLNAGENAVAKSITINGGAITTVSTSSLVINGSSSRGILLFNAGTFTNRGAIEINSTGGDGITIQNTNTTFNNNGLIKIGNAGAIYNNGIALGGGTFTNTATVSIDSTTNGSGITIANSSFTNSGTLKIGDNNSIRFYGVALSTSGVFTNQGAGDVAIDRCKINGLYLLAASSSFTNNGVLKIGNVAAITSIGIFEQQGAFTNTNSIEINRTGGDGINKQGTSTFDNSGTLKIGNAGAIGGSGINSSGGTFTNTATVSIDSSTNGNGIFIGSSSFTNSGTLKVGSNNSIRSNGIELSTSGVFTNQGAGDVAIDRCKQHGLYLVQASSSFTNNGILKIGNVAAITFNGIGQNQGTFTNTNSLEINRTGGGGISKGGTSTFDNSGSIKIGNAGAIGGDGIASSGGTFTNTATVAIDSTPGGSGISLSSSSFTNSGTVNIGKNNSISVIGITLSTSGAFTNQGTGNVAIDRCKQHGISLGNSSSTFTNNGKLKIGNVAAITFNGIGQNQGTFTNTDDIEINRTGGDGINRLAGTFDNSGSIKIGNLSAVAGGGVSSVGGSFTNQSTGNIAIDRCFLGISSIGATTSFTNNGKIKIGNNAAVGGLGIFQSGGTFTNTDGLEINNTGRDGIYKSAGAFNNNGSLKIGNVGAIGGNGGINSGGGTFTNTVTVSIDAATNGISLDNSSFTNSGSVKVGSNNSIGSTGVSVSNSGVFSNQSAGSMAIDRSFFGIILSSASSSFTNNGELKIGNIAAISSNGIAEYQGSFINTNSLEINRTGNDAIYKQGTSTFDNSGSLKIGNLAAINGSGINSVAGTFTNQSTGTVEIDQIPDITAGNAAVALSSTGAFNNQGMLRLGTFSSVKHGIGNQSGTGASFTNSGTVQFGDIIRDGILAAQTVTNNSGGLIETIPTGKLRIAGTLTNNSGGTVTNNATGVLTITSTGLLTNNGPLNNNGTVSNNGNIKGTGTIVQNGTFTNAPGSLLSPGQSPGQLNVTGNFDLGNSTYNAEINGSTAGNQYDVLAVSGTATLTNASLTVNWGTFTPSPGESYTILTAGAITGTFSTVTIPAKPNLVFTVTYTATSVVVNAASSNVAPTDITLSNNTVAENQASGTAVGTFTTTDADAGQTHTYTLVAGAADNASFAIAGNQLNTAASFNFETKSSYTILVETTDNGSPAQSFQKQFTIAVTNVNEAPTDITLSNNTVAENQPGNTLVGTFSTTDPDAGQTFTYTLLNSPGTNPTSFVIVGNELRTDETFNFEAKSSYTILVSTTDNGSPAQSFEKQFTITVTDVNETPTDITLSNNTVAENQPGNTLVGTFSTTDPDAGQTFTYALVNAPGTNPTSFVIVGNELRTDETFNFEAKNSYTILVRTTDNGSPAQSYDKQFTITVTDVNEAPVITGGDNVSLSRPENNTAVTTVTATDPDASPTLTYSIPAAGGADSSKFIINAATGALTFKTAPDFEIPTDTDEEGKNTYKVIVRVSDGSLTDDQTITVIITNVNDAPVITSNGGGDTARINVAENTTFVTNVQASDQDVNISSAYSITGGADRTKFTISSTTGELRFITAPDFEAPTDADGNNTYIVNVRAQDQGGLSDDQLIIVTVTGANDNPPVITSDGGGATASRSIPENSTAVTTVTATDADAGTTMTYSINGGADQAKFTMDASTGALRFITAPDFENPTDADRNNTYIVIVRASDGTMTDDQAMTVTITDVSDAALPVHLVNARAYQKTTGSIQVDWTTITESNTDRFEVEKSTDGQSFTLIGTVNARGNSNSQVNYQYLDNAAVNGSNYYRIKVIDKNGFSQYSNVVRVNVEKGSGAITVYPNPVTHNTISLQLSNLRRGKYTVTLTNKLGQQLYRSVIEHNGGSSTQTLRINGSIPKGSYQLQVIGDEVQMTKQLIKN